MLKLVAVIASYFVNGVDFRNSYCCKYTRLQERVFAVPALSATRAIAVAKHGLVVFSVVSRLKSGRISACYRRESYESGSLVMTTSLVLVVEPGSPKPSILYARSDISAMKMSESMPSFTVIQFSWRTIVR